MNVKLAVLATVAVALGAVPIASNAQSHATPKTSEVTAAVRPATELTETQWLRERVVQLEAALIAGENCPAATASAKPTGSTGMKPSPKAGMAPADEKKMMGGGMKGKGMKTDPAPMPMQPTATPAATPAPPMPMPMMEDDM